MATHARSSARPAPYVGSRFLIVTSALMLVFYGLVYHPYEETSLPARLLIAYLQLSAQGSAALLRWLGEPVTITGTLVTGRFPYVVVLDCAALDAQALFTAAVLAFPTSMRAKSLGLVAGLTAIGLLNVGRLVLLYFAGARSFELFRVLHEEVFVLLIILWVCGLFFAWARWSVSAGRQLAPVEARATAAA